MSFRARMLAFFVIIVMIPMVAVSIVLLRLASESEIGRANSRLALAASAAQTAYGDARDMALDELRRVSRARRLQLAFLRGDRRVLRRAVRPTPRKAGGIESVVLYGEGGRPIASAGTDQALAYAVSTPTDRRGRPVGAIAVSTTTAGGYARYVARLGGLEVRVVRDGAVLAETLEGAEGAKPLAMSIAAADGDFRGRYTTLEDTVGPAVQVGVFQDLAAIDDDRPLIAAILLGFFLLAVLSSVLVARSLGGHISGFLAAARAVGRGDFDARVPAKGGDEFAALGREFNEMAAQLKDNVDELEHRRGEREKTIRRIGEAFAAGPDPRGIATLAARTAVEACRAEAGHAIFGELATGDPTVVGPEDPELRAALEAAEREAEQSPEATAAVAGDEAHACATALRGRPDAEGRRETLGYLAIARRRAEFDPAERELFDHMAGQASVSLDNAILHETVQRQAVTDPLTGLRNRRHFDAALDAEIARARRFGGELGLVMIDLDRFKRINDRYGHPEGDRVLVEVANLLRRHTRDVDEVARFGGDEMAILLPQTDLAGAQLLAARVREDIEALAIHSPPAGGKLSVTASLGVAALPESASDQAGLVGAADAGLYDAKGAGGNRVGTTAPARAGT